MAEKEPPPVPSTPPSKSRILALKCYRKVSHSFAKGIKKVTTRQSSVAGGSSLSSDSEQESSPSLKKHSFFNEESPTKVPTTPSFDAVSSSVSGSSSSQPEDQISVSVSALYENMEFFPSSPQPTLRFVDQEEIIKEEDDDDSSKWTISAPSSCENNVIQPSSSEPPPQSTINNNNNSQSSIVIKRPVCSPPPVPTYPHSSSSSSDDSFSSCASNPEKLAAIPDKTPKRVKDIGSVWGTVRYTPNKNAFVSLGHVISENDKSDDNDDATDAPGSDLDSDLDVEQLPGEDLVEAVTKGLISLNASKDFPCEERPETGPGEEDANANLNNNNNQEESFGDDDQGENHSYQNVAFVQTTQETNTSSEPVIHVIPVPPRVIEVVKERRRKSSVEEETHGRSSRLSRLLQSDVKAREKVGVGVAGGIRVGQKVRRWMGRSRSKEGAGVLLEEEPVTLTATMTDSTVKVEEGSCVSKQGANEFEELRRLVKQGGDFCKDLAAVLHERAELESQYAKGLSKLSGKLLKASKEARGTVTNAWQAVAVQIDTQAELHRQWSTSLEDELAKPLRTSTETQHKIRKSVEVLVDKTTRNLADWRLAEAKAKRHCFSSSKEYEKLQNQENNSQTSSASNINNGSSNNNPPSELMRTRSRLLSVPPSSDAKDPIKLESKRRKAEEGVRRADVDYYTFCVRSERARLEWESAIRNGSTCLRTLEEEKLSLLKELAEKYLGHLLDFGPRCAGSVEALEEPVKGCNVSTDIHAISDIRRHVGAEQLLPDFYAEDTSNLMSRVRRREALDKCGYLIRQDLDRERKGAVGVESLAKAVAEGPKIDNSHHDITDKLYYMRSMLLYLEASRCKVDNAISDVESRPRSSHPIMQYMRHQRDKQGLPQTILKVPSWAREDCLSFSSPDSSPNWNERGKADGTSASHNQDFDEFASEGSEEEQDRSKPPSISIEGLKEVDDEKAVVVNSVRLAANDGPSIGRCRAIYDYEANLFDELTIRIGEEINIHDKQDDGWWLGELNGVVGIFPATYVEEVSSSTA